MIDNPLRYDFHYVPDKNTLRGIRKVYTDNKTGEEITEEEYET